MNINDAFSTDSGFIVGENNDGPFYTGGADSPVGKGLPYNTFYIQSFPNAQFRIWNKVGVGDTASDWRVFNSLDVPLDPTGLLNLMPSDTDVYKAIARLGNQSVAELAEIEGFNSLNFETTTSNGWVSKTNFPWTSVSVKTAGIFSIRWSVEVGQTKATRNFGFRIRWRPSGGTWTDLSSIASFSVSKDNNTAQQSGFKEVTLPMDNNIEIDLQYGQTLEGFAAIMENATVEIRRLGGL